MQDYTILIQELFRGRNVISSSEIKSMMPGIPEQTVFSRVREMERSGLIYRQGRGLYARGTKMEYKVDFTSKVKEINALLIQHFEGVNHCISTNKDNILVETERKYTDTVLVFLKRYDPNVYSFKEALRLLPLLQSVIIVKPLITDAPIFDEEGFFAPSLEKLLVDMVADKPYYEMTDENIQKEFQRSFEVYPVLKDRLLRYAGRRGVREEVEAILDHINPYRIQTITTLQTILRSQPVLQAWLFGSWSRQEERQGSDIDLLVHFDPTARVSLMDHATFQLELQGGVGHPIDLVTDGTLLPFVKRNVDKEKYLIYERRR